MTISRPTYLIRYSADYRPNPNPHAAGWHEADDPSTELNAVIRTIAQGNVAPPLAIIRMLPDGTWTDETMDVSKKVLCYAAGYYHGAEYIPSELKEWLESRLDTSQLVVTLHTLT